MFRKTTLTLLAIAGIILSACTTPTATPTPPEQPTQAPGAAATNTPEPTAAPSAPEPKDSETFTWYTFGDPQSLDPHIDYESAGGGVLQNIYENLVQFNGKDPTSFVPLLAESIPDPVTGDDGSVTYTWTIRDGISFHNGAPLTAEDVAYSFWRSMLLGDPNAPSILVIEPFFAVTDATQLVDSSGALVGDPDALKASDTATLASACERVKSAVTFDNASRTVKMRLPRPWGPFIATLAGGPWASVINRQWAAEQGDWDGDCATWQNFYGIPIENGVLKTVTNGTGAYILDHWTPEDEIVLNRNENYWREPAAIKRVVIKNVTEFGTRFAALQTGDADTISLGSKADEVQMDTLVRDTCDGETGECTTVNPDGILRSYKGLLNTARTDVAITFRVAEDSPYIGSGQLDGNGIPPDFFSDVHIRRAFNYCFDWETYIKDVLLGDGQQSIALSLPGQLGYDGSPHYTFDLEKCAEEFKQSTWTSADGQSLWDVGFYLQIGYNAGNTQRQTIAEILAANVNAVNPKFFISPLALPWPTFLAARTARQFAVVSVGWGEDIHDPHNWYSPYLVGTNADRGAIPQELRDKYAALMNQGAVELDPAKRAAIYSDLNKLIYEDAPYIILAYQTRTRYEPLYLKGWFGGLNQNPLVNNFYYYDFSK